MMALLAVLPVMAEEETTFTFSYNGSTLIYKVLDEDAKTVCVHAFSMISSDVQIPSTVAYGQNIYTVSAIGNGAFYNCQEFLISIKIPETVTSIEDDAFFGCNGLQKAEFASIESLCKIEFKSLSSNPLSYAHNLYINGKEITEITIPNSITSIRSNAFHGCSGLTSVTIGNSVTSIGEYAFDRCTGLTSVTIGNSVTSIGEGAFYECSGLTSVTIGNSVTSIGQSAFYGCSGLTSVTIPESVTSIGSRAFTQCLALASVTIPNSVTSIGESAFANCRSLTNIVIPNSVTSIEDWTFSQCTSLKSVTIPSSITSIGAYAFNNCDSLTSVEIPSSVTSIGRFAFYSCDALNKAEFASIEWLCGVAFENFASNPLYYAHNLYINGQEITEVRIPDSVTAIGIYAFAGCEYITSLSIPNTVTSFGNGAFEGCTGLTSVYYNTENPIDANSNVFQCRYDDIYQNAFLYVPEAAVEKCKAVEPWSLFKNIKAYDFSGLEGIKADFNEDEPYEVYNLNGIKVVNDIESLEAGLYIVRQGANVKKIVVK